MENGETGKSRKQETELGKTEKCPTNNLAPKVSIENTVGNDRNKNLVYRI